MPYTSAKKMKDQNQGIGFAETEEKKDGSEGAIADSLRNGTKSISLRRSSAGMTIRPGSTVHLKCSGCGLNAHVCTVLPMSEALKART